MTVAPDAGAEGRTRTHAAADACAECGAHIPAGGSCRDNFNAVLALEWQVSAPEAAGRQAHFYAVSSYVLQHPDSMRYTASALAWLRSSVASMLAGDASVDTIRASARDRSHEARVTRREGDPVPVWDVQEWSMTVEDVLAAGADGYCERVERWAASVLDDLRRAEEG